MTRKQIIKHHKAHFGIQDIPFKDLGSSDKLMIKWAEDLVKNCSIPVVSVSESDIDAMFPFEDVERARPTRPKKRILAYNSRQADRREGAKRLLSKLHSR